MTVGLDMILSKDDVSFGMDRYEETERERVILESGNRERIPLPKAVPLLVPCAMTSALSRIV